MLKEYRSFLKHNLKLLKEGLKKDYTIDNVIDDIDKVLERLGNIAKNMIIVNYLKIYKRCSV
jgi:hypothetical protein